MLKSNCTFHSKPLRLERYFTQHVREVGLSLLQYKAHLRTHVNRLKMGNCTEQGQNGPAPDTEVKGLFIFVAELLVLVTRKDKNKWQQAQEKC